jgi:DNA-binding MarR family transcriptional regulator
MQNDADVLERAVTAVAQAARLLDAPRLHVWDERGITLPQLRILFRLRQEPGLGVKELAQAFGVSASNVTQQVDKLVARGLVARVERPGDRRQVQLTLTPEGEAVAGEISHTARTYLRALLGQVPTPDLEELTRVLGHVMALARTDVVSPGSSRPDAEAVEGRR